MSGSDAWLRELMAPPDLRPGQANDADEIIPGPTPATHTHTHTHTYTPLTAARWLALDGLGRGAAGLWLGNSTAAREAAAAGGRTKGVVNCATVDARECMTSPRD